MLSEKSQHKKTNTVYELPTGVKFTETESKIMVTRVLEEEEKDSCCSMDIVSVLPVEKVMEICFTQCKHM